MGKTPLLPIFAASLGATNIFLGLIVSVSTLTGMLLKPLIGLLSDSWGRRSWLIADTLFFTIVPFTYSFVHTPEQLFAIRIIHGLATAIYGPVTLAYVAEQSSSHCAEHIGWFSMARTASYILGPLIAGWLLLSQEPTTVFTIIGIFSSCAFLPILYLPDSNLPQSKSPRSLTKKMLVSLWSASKLRSIWLAGSLEATMYMALYGVKAFLPVYGLSVGLNVAMIGSFFAIQEGAHLLLKPWAGRLGDRFGHPVAISLGLAVLGSALLMVTLCKQNILLILSALAMGCSQFLITPSAIALVSHQVSRKGIGMGVGMGLIGMLKNAGKVLGPVLIGVMIHQMDFIRTFYLTSVTLLLISSVVAYRVISCRRNQDKKPTQYIGKSS